MVLQPDDYSYRLDAADPTGAAAAEGSLVVVLDVVQDEGLRMEGEARDLNRAIQDLRKRAGLRYSDRIVVSIRGNGLDPLLAAFGAWLMEQTLAVDLTTGPLQEVLVAGAARLGSGSVQVAIGPVPADLHRPATGLGDQPPAG
jgi:hypothetical protein